jgi:hypothetical protein
MNFGSRAHGAGITCFMDGLDQAKLTPTSIEDRSVLADGVLAEWLLRPIREGMYL